MFLSLCLNEISGDFGEFQAPVRREGFVLKFNYHRDASALYDISDAYKILRLLHIIDKSLEFTELVISPNGVFSSAGRSDLVAALNKIHHPAATNVCLYTCGRFIFTIGYKSGNFFIMDTHSIGKELEGNGNGFLNGSRSCNPEPLRLGDKTTSSKWHQRRFTSIFS